MGFKNCGSKLVGSRYFFLYKYLWDNSHTIVKTGASMAPTNDIIEEIKKDSMLKWKLSQ